MSDDTRPQSTKPSPNPRGGPSKRTVTHPDFAPILAEIREAARELNVLAEEANQLVETTDQALAEANVGIEVWVDEVFATKPICDSDGDTVGGERILIGYGKAKEGWGLALKHCEGYYDGPDGVEIELLRQASRDQRVDAYRWIPVVLARIAAVLRERKERIERAPGTSE